MGALRSNDRLYLATDWTLNRHHRSERCVARNHSIEQKNSHRIDFYNLSVFSCPNILVPIPLKVRGVPLPGSSNNLFEAGMFWGPPKQCFCFL